MNGAIFYSTRYGSTAQYARWIGAATDLPVLNVKDVNADPSKYDFIILGSPIIYYKLIIKKWVNHNLSNLVNRPLIMFTVSGAPAGAKLDGWIADSLPQELVSHMKHVALLGRSNPKDLEWWVRMKMIIGAMMNPDPVARKEELKGFDKMDKSSIKPIVEMVKQLQSSKTLV